ncbi:MAG: hypothetical protein JRI23_01305 [Deltaproteobacteria bacterium]|jgi:hypothetical protein|nr:hypothetical protein [Deltaproteobacteria bacterium]MBW2530092.1 hypothetical protein [Deltaproteobacteria bacterium]
MKCPADVRLALWLLAAVCFCAWGCSAGGGTSDDDDSTGGTGGGSIFEDGGTGNTLFDGGSGDSGSGDGCSEASKYVYVVDQNRSFYRFDPSIANTSAFQLVGTLNCSVGLEPQSMSISREGYAYVLYGQPAPLQPGGFGCQALNQVEIETANCLAPTPFTCGSGGFTKFGMGYATDGQGITDETLFIGSSIDTNFGSLDVATGVVQPRGNMPIQGPEFTGNANGELWGFFPYGTPPELKQIDKTTGGQLTSIPLGSLPNVNSGLMAAWAFAYWGGSFYVFYMVDPPNTSTQVYKVEYDGTVANYIPNTGLVVVGAGVSTCAPIAPPR